MSQLSSVSVYQFKVTSRDSKPPIWRRIQMRSDTTLYKLHQTLQVVMGWSDYHLHQFVIHGVYFGEAQANVIRSLREGFDRLRALAESEA